MTDPIERVARAMVNAEEWSSFWSEAEAKILARHMITEHKAWLTEQGIPIDKLLSGEMRAVEYTAGMARLDSDKIIKPFDGMISLDEAQLDYAGGQIVTPEDKG